MVIKLGTGNLLEADVEALVNTVNTVGFMGKGIAAQFKRAYPDNFTYYKAACERGDVVPCQMLVYTTGTLTSPRYIINFPTKRHWRAKSRKSDVECGLVSLVHEVRSREIRSIALPALGCGNGGLDWEDIRPLIEKAFESMPEVDVVLFGPPPSRDDRHSEPPPR